LHTFLFTIPIFCASTIVFAGPVESSHGRIERIEKFESKYVDARNVDVWLPDGYTPNSPTKRYAVLYMHDGQMLFDAKTTWNKKAWHIDRTISMLAAEGKIRDTIVVGIWNAGELRHSEFFPEKALVHMNSAHREKFIELGLRGKARADAYLRFIVTELKPEIDRRYATLTDADNTFLMGSSMGP
jgi:predicted alpha/beta superfamily hydrolase